MAEAAQHVQEPSPHTEDTTMQEASADCSAVQTLKETFTRIDSTYTRCKTSLSVYLTSVTFATTQADAHVHTSSAPVADSAPHAPHKPECKLIRPTPDNAQTALTQADRALAHQIPSATPVSTFTHPNRSSNKTRTQQEESSDLWSNALQQDLAILSSDLQAFALAAESLSLSLNLCESSWDHNGLTHTQELLESIGLELWNRAISLKNTSIESCEVKTICATIRRTAFYSIQALYALHRASKHTLIASAQDVSQVQADYDRLEQRQVIRLLETASHTASALKASGQAHAASFLLERAAQYCEVIETQHHCKAAHSTVGLTMTTDHDGCLSKVRNSYQAEHAHLSVRHSSAYETQAQTAASKALLLFHCTRAEFAWEAHKVDLTFHMLCKAAAEEILKHCTMIEIERLGRLTLTCGLELLKVDMSREKAFDFLKLANTVLDCPAAHQVNALSVLKVTAMRAYASSLGPSTSTSDAQRIEQAETTIKTLVRDSPNFDTFRTYLQWLIVRRGKDGDILQVFEQACHAMPTTENAVEQLLQDTQGIINRRPLKLQLLVCLLRAAVQKGATHATGSALLACLFFVRYKDLDSVHQIFDVINSESRGKLEHDTALACQSRLWQLGDKCYHEDDIATAACWYEKAGNDIFAASGRAKQVKSLRKSAICHLHLSDHKKAEELMRACGEPDEAGHFNAKLLAAMLKGNPRETSENLRRMMDSGDFDQHSLVWIYRMAFDLEQNNVVGQVLSAIGKMCARSLHGPAAAELLTTLRHLIDVTAERLDSVRGLDHNDLLGKAVAFFEAGISVVKQIEGTAKDISDCNKELHWMHQQAAKLCEQYANVLDKPTMCLLYETTAKLTERVLVHETNASRKSKLNEQLLISKFALAALKVGNIGPNDELPLQEAQQSDEMISTITTHIEQEQQIEQSPVIERVYSALQVLIFKIRAAAAEWERMLACMNHCMQLKAAWQITAAMADFALQKKLLPGEVLANIMQLTMQAQVSSGHLDIAAFSRWLHATVAILTLACQLDKSYEYLVQALEVMKQSDEGAIPQEERDWIITTTWNMGLTLSHNKEKLVEAKKWCELALAMAKLSKDQTQYETMMHTYENEVAKRFETRVYETVTTYTTVRDEVTGEETTREEKVTREVTKEDKSATGGQNQSGYTVGCESSQQVSRTSSYQVQRVETHSEGQVTGEHMQGGQSKGCQIQGTYEQGNKVQSGYAVGDSHMEQSLSTLTFPSPRQVTTSTGHLEEVDECNMQASEWSSRGGHISPPSSTTTASSSPTITRMTTSVVSSISQPEYVTTSTRNLCAGGYSGNRARNYSVDTQSSLSTTAAGLSEERWTVTPFKPQ
ncbi:hypothetical protein E5Q_04101 [Mixia osmundae IAM 14324]|uniref:Protein ZIP4 homolog n=1 Tax=Mixia osmundae (strain CBS 9802 / IAM 14324 / JCM 22182 / KY 12970) TaxID=764103 RepID=G7E3L2_MIXOS|nr:hypothetical protein E5Q_04101 [Mixia osmundae IAM 14324]